MSEKDKRDVWGELVGTAAARRPGGHGDAETIEEDAQPETARYQAFKAVDGRVECLSIYTTTEPANAHVSYQFYQYMLDDKRGKIFDIVFGFFVVRVRGKNLLPVIHAIKSRRCVFIQQYQRHPEWPAPEPGDPVIEKIEIVYQPSSRVAMLEKGPANV
jgi:hypothetical protein